MAFSDEWRDLVDNVDDASAEPINQIAHEVIKILLNNTLVEQELLKKENISNKIKDYPLESWDIVTDEQYFGAKSVAKNIHDTAIMLGDHMHNVYEEQQHITADERTAWNAKADVMEVENRIYEEGLDAIMIRPQQKEYRITGDVSGILNLMFNDEDTNSENYSCLINFTADSGCEFFISDWESENTQIIMRGDDVSSDGTFTPVAGTMYEIAFKKVNEIDGKTIVVGRVGAV